MSCNSILLNRKQSLLIMCSIEATWCDDEGYHVLLIKYMGISDHGRGN